jgi:putative intracellular protease/amidase
MTNTTNTELPRRALIVLTSHDQLGSTGKKTGAYLAEITHVYWTLIRAGIEVDFVSPKGGQVPLDGVDRADAENASFLDDRAALARLHASHAPAQVDASRYAAIYFAGGHGTMWDLPGDAGLARIAAQIYEAGGIVSAVCHGPAGLVNIRLSTGAYLVANKQLAAFTDEEERAVGLTEVVPFLLASTLTERGARHIAAPNFQKNVVVSERLITGQNPASARGVGEALVAALAAPARANRSIA